ncbi:MAG: 4Fe-4S binding protein [Candidatus Gastranaerophilales bacterium]|nr:4Fe-4S binding protein [Candidatus Gastranaerophilales bacterium]MCM1073470.1 4Fe-4S binding protein [Bacteroides sp.]
MPASKFIIKTLINDVRMSTQELLQLITTKIEEGVNEFEIEACGQHNIGIGGKYKNNNLLFHVTNPGQRVGAMGMEGTTIIVDGSAPADIGWLNSGAKIVVKGDAGDTAAHCAAGGKIYVGGRVGTRSGALMKHDPKFEQPEFWVLKNTGSFSFEFMGGGRAVICGYDSEDLPSVLGNRSCVGMVGGTVYVRGKIEGIASCVETKKLDKFDKDFLKSGMSDFLKEIERPELLQELLDFSKWIKLVPLAQKTKTERISIKEFKQKEWFADGLFGDLIEDNGDLFNLAQSGEARLRKPEWNKELCIGCNLCTNNCPQKAIAENYSVKEERCIGCGICSAVCPKKAWQMIK